jgi:hypothetical protein
MAVSEGAEGRAVIMERQIADRPDAGETAASVTEAAEEITLESAEAQRACEPKRRTVR